MTYIISYLSDWDQKNSEKVHSMVTSKWMEMSLFIPVNLFQPVVFPMLVACMSLLFPMVEMEMK